MTTGAQITLAHSPDPDDVFMWWPITGLIEPPVDPQQITPARVISRPELDTGRFRFAPIAADIAALNRHAMAGGVGAGGGGGGADAGLDITAISMFAWAHVRDRYALTSMGASMGYGYGPRLVVPARTQDSRSDRPPQPASAPCYLHEAEPRRATVADMRRPETLIAVPGVGTTAFLLLSMILGPGSFRYIEMPFDAILDAVAHRRSGITAGLLIHQSQLTFADLGLELVVDVGDWWLKQTGLPLPLGGNAVRRDLDARFGPGSMREIVGLLNRSVRYALAHRERSIEYCMCFAPEISREQAERYIDMYVSDLTVDAGEAGRGAVQRLLEEGAKLGMCPHPGIVAFERPS